MVPFEAICGVCDRKYTETYAETTTEPLLPEARESVLKAWLAEDAEEERGARRGGTDSDAVMTLKNDFDAFLLTISTRVACILDISLREEGRE